MAGQSVYPSVGHPCFGFFQKRQIYHPFVGIEFDIEKVTDISDIIKFNVMITPALVVDGDVKSSGKLLPADDIKDFLK